MKRADIVIVGGGIIGLAAAWRLQQAGARTLVVDAGLPAATAAAAGMLAPSFEGAHMSLAGPFYALCAAALETWRGFAAELESETGRTIDYRPDGVLGVAFRASEEALMRRAGADLAARGADVVLLDAKEIADIEPALARDARAGIFARRDGQVDPRRAAAALSLAVTARGGEIRSGRVVSIAAGENGATAALASGEVLDAAAIVVAAGAAATKIAGPARLPVFPVKGEALILSTGETAPLRRVVRAPGAYLCPKTDGRLYVGASERPHDSSSEPDDEAIGALRRSAARAVPRLAGLAEAGRWSGLRPCTPDAAPILGPHPVGPDRIAYALGHHRNGVLLAPETARLLVRYLDGAGTADRMDPFGPFGPARFNH